MGQNREPFDLLACARCALPTPRSGSQGRFRIRGVEPAEGFEPPTRALRKRSSLSHHAPHGPDEPYFVSENRLHHPTAAQPVAPVADKLVGKLSATIGGPGETLTASAALLRPGLWRLSDLAGAAGLEPSTSGLEAR